MSTFGYDDLANTASELITEAGRIVQLVRFGAGPHDPDKPWLGDGRQTIESSVSLPMVFVPAITEGLGGYSITSDLLQRVEQVGIAAAKDGAHRGYNAVIDSDGSQWGVEWVQILTPAETSLICVYGIKR